MNQCLYTGFALAIALGHTAAWAGTPWERFLADPSSEAAVQVYEISYSQPRLERELPFDLQVLQDRVEAGDQAALDLAFRALRNSDGHTAEELTIVIGSGIAPNPEAFLKALVRSNLAQEVSALIPAVVGNLGQGYVDRPAAQEYEVQARIEALQSVPNTSLVEVRNQCISELRRKLTILQEWQQDE